MWRTIIGHTCLLLHSRYVKSANVMDTTWVSDDGGVRKLYISICIKELTNCRLLHFGADAEARSRSSRIIEGIRDYKLTYVSKFNVYPKKL